MLVCCLYFAPGLGDVAPYIRFGVPLESLAQDILQAGDTAVGAAVGEAGAAAAARAAAAAAAAQDETATTGQLSVAAGDAEANVKLDSMVQTSTAAADTAASAYLLHLLQRHQHDPYIVQLRQHRLPSHTPTGANVGVLGPATTGPTPILGAEEAAHIKLGPSSVQVGAKIAQHRTHVVEVALQRCTTPALRLKAYVHALHLWLLAVDAPTPGGTTSYSGGSGSSSSDTLTGGRGSKPGGGGGGSAAAAAAAAGSTASAGSGRGGGIGRGGGGKGGGIGGVVGGGAGVQDAGGGRKHVVAPGSCLSDTNEGEAVGSEVSGVAAVSEAWMAKSYDGFLEAMVAAGWQVDRLLLPLPEWTSLWGDSLHED